MTSRCDIGMSSTIFSRIDRRGLEAVEPALEICYGIEARSSAGPDLMHEMQFDHLGLVVDDLDRGRRHMSAGFGITGWTQTIVDELNGVRLQFGRDGAGVTYELLEPLSQSSPVYVALRTGSAILNHVAYRVRSLAAVRSHFLATGWVQTGEPKPAVAFGGHHIQFFMNPLGMIVEVIEGLDYEHTYERG